MSKQRISELVVKKLDVISTLVLGGTKMAASSFPDFDNLTATVDELNTLDGVTATFTEINKLAGLTATTAEIEKLAGLSTTAAELEILSSLTATTAEIEKLAGLSTTAAELEKLAGVTASTAELSTSDGAPMGATFVIGAEGGDVINVGIQLEDADGADLAVRGCVYAYISDDANGDSVTASVPDGGVTIGTDGLAVPLVADQVFMLTSEADGDIDLDLDESGTPTFYLIVRLANGKLAASAAITFA